MGILDGKVAVITGASRGLGLAAARTLAAEGARVLLSARSAEVIRQEAAQIGAQAAAFACDVSVLEQVQALAGQAVAVFGGFDIWVNNAGYGGPYGPTELVDPRAFRAVTETNVLGTYHGSLVAMRHFTGRGSGKLINVLGAGADKPVPFQSAYGSSKAWVRMFTLALAAEHKGSGVGVFALRPGLMKTELIEKIDVVAGYEQRMKAFEVVQRMWANPPELAARKILWLASTATDGKTGLDVNVSSTGMLLGGALRELWRRLRGRPAPESALTVTKIPPAG